MCLNLMVKFCDFYPIDIHLKADTSCLHSYLWYECKKKKKLLKMHLKPLEGS